MDLGDMFVEELKQKGEDARKGLKKLLENPMDVESINEVFRAFHTVKGSASLVGYSGFQKLFHELEEILKEWKRDPSTVDLKLVTRLQEVLDYLEGFEGDVSEEDLEKVRAILEGREISEEKKLDLKDTKEFKEFVERFLDDLVEMETQMRFGSVELAQITLTRMKRRLVQLHEEMEYVPLEKVLSGFETMVLKDAVDMGKEVELVLNVEGAKIEREEARVFRDVLLHVVRNAVVHGVEKPDVRERMGKPRRGRIEVRARIEGNSLITEVEDDGKGIDFERLVEKARELGITYSDPTELLYIPNLSTLEKSDVRGGRGVGLDAVKEYVDRRGGEVSVETEKGKGTLFRIVLPLRRYLRSCLIVKRSGAVLAIEIGDVDEIVQRGEIFFDENRRYIGYSGRSYRFEDLGRGEFHFVVLCGEVAIAVDEILGVRETSIKPGKTDLSFVKGFAMGIDKFPVPVVNPKALRTIVEETGVVERILVVDDSPLTRLVVLKMLERAGFKVSSAVDGRSALDAIRREKPDYAIIDLELPDMNGFELIERIREEFPDVSIAVLTTNVSEENEKRAREMGVSFFAKGEDIDDLLRFLRGV